MALNSDFKVKDSLYVGNSACFVTQTDTPVILSAGSSLFDIFLQEDEVSSSCALTSGLGIDTFFFSGSADASVAVDGAVIDGIAEGTAQGQIAVTNLDNTTSQINVNSLGATDSPTFGGLTVTGLSATSANAGILSAGVDLNEIFVTSAEAGSVCSVSAGNPTVTIGGTSANPTVRIADNCVTALSGAYCESTSGTQGNIGFTRLNGGTDTLDIGLCAGDSVQFVGICATGNITTSGTVDGVDIAARDAVLTTTTNKANAALPLSGGEMSGNITFSGSQTVDGVDISARDAVLTSTTTTANAALPKTGGAMTGAITTNSTFDGVCVSARDTVLTSTTTTANAALPKTGGAMTGAITTNSTFDGVCVSELATCAGLTCTGSTNGSGTAGTLTVWDGTTCLGDSIVSETTVGGNSTLTIGGSAVIQGDLTVDGTFTCLNTQVTVTSAFEICNCGTGPALYAEQEGTNCAIACFVDAEGGTIIFDDGGNVGIGCASPGQKLVVSGAACITNNTDIDGNLTVDGNTTLGDAASDAVTVNACGITFGNGIAGGSDSERTVVILNGSGVTQTNEIDAKVWGTALVDGEGTQNAVPKYTNGTGTIGDSSITDTGTLITLDADVTIGNGDSIKIPATGGSIYTEEQTFTATVGTSGTTVATFPKSGFRSAKYVVTLASGVNRTAFEVLVIYNDTEACGTVYAIVDAQTASQLTSVDVTNTGSTIDLVITSAANSTTAIIKGSAQY